MARRSGDGSWQYLLRDIFAKESFYSGVSGSNAWGGLIINPLSFVIIGHYQQNEGRKISGSARLWYASFGDQNADYILAGNNMLRFIDAWAKGNGFSVRWGAKCGGRRY